LGEGRREGQIPQLFGPHAIDRGATLPEVQATLGHANVSTTSGYLHARPNTSSGLHSDPGVVSSMRMRATVGDKGSALPV
jgi:integrase